MQPFRPFALPVRFVHFLKGKSFRRPWGDTDLLIIVSKRGRGVWIWIWMRRTCHVWTLRERKVAFSYEMTFKGAGVIMRMTISPAFSSTDFHYLKSPWLTCSSIIFKRFEVHRSFFLHQELINMNKAVKSLSLFSFYACENNELSTDVMCWDSNNKAWLTQHLSHVCLI
jgi:hypothetical protein